MRYQDLFEGRNSKCIVVDVQPTYTGVDNIFGSTLLPMVKPLMNFLNKQGPILAFVNAEDTGVSDDRIIDIKENWESAGFNANRWNNTEIVDKGYGYFRAWMDEGVQPDVIIKVIRTMYQQKVTDSRELFDGDESDNYQEQMQQLIGNAWEEWMIDDTLSVEWTSVGQLKKYNGAYIMGGGRDECLREVELLMNAFNIKYKRIEDFVYG
jgi:hypothetical protein|tara:strand:- start:8 stop:634 length:627 start_codon:yes stop_codon:yes gene_type:complete